jgi:predicted secreted protein
VIYYSDFHNNQRAVQTLVLECYEVIIIWWIKLFVALLRNSYTFFNDQQFQHKVKRSEIIIFVK